MPSADRPSPFLEAFSDSPDEWHEPGTGISGPGAASPYEIRPEGEAEVLDKANDSRDRVTNTLRVPHRWVCHLETWWRTPQLHGRFFGTGILVGPRHLLTVAHNLHRIIGGEVTTAEKMRVIPARDAATEPFGRTWAAVSKGEVVARRPKGWIVHQGGQVGINHNYDVALVLLDDELQGRRHKGVELGYWGWPPHSAVERLEPDQIRRYFVGVTGYPETVASPRRQQAFVAATQWQSLGRLTTISSQKWRCWYDADTSDGQSGGPVWLWEDGKAHLLAVHGGGTTTNFGVRITRKLLQWITAWSQEWEKGVKEVGEVETEAGVWWAAPAAAEGEEEHGGELDPEAERGADEVVGEAEEETPLPIASPVRGPEAKLEADGEAGSGLSRVAVHRIKEWPASRNRPSDWQGRVYGLVVHTTGGGLPEKALARDVSPVDFAVRFYQRTRGTHYVNGWAGIEGGELVQVADERVRANGVGVARQRASIGSPGGWEDDVPAVLVRLWRRRWPDHAHPLDLLPEGERSVNRCYVHVECPPCYWGWGRFRSGASRSVRPMRPGLRFTRAQHDAVAALAVDVAERNGWPRGEWWRSPRLLGHEDLSPISRHDRRGGWDPGGLRESPYFDWEYVWSQIERRVAGGASAAGIVRGLAALPGALVSGAAAAARAAQRLILAGREAQAVERALADGMTDESRLTNLVFFTRHPELGGRKLRPEERDLAREWLEIRRDLVRPALRRAGHELFAAPGQSDDEPSRQEAVELV